MDELARLGAVSLHCDAVLLDENVLLEARSRRVPVLCYTVNQPDMATRLFGKGVSALFTDRLDLFAGA
jgi:glycerophosphoryl diester phosphodiesterase